MLAETFLCEAFEAAVGRFLALDPGHRRLLQPLAGRVISVNLTPPGIEFFLSPTLDTVLILPAYEGQPDTRLTGSPLAFLRLVLSEHPQSELFSGALAIEGNIDIARRLQTVMQRLDLDWEGWLAQLTGQSLAKQTFDWIRAASAWHRHAWRTLQWNLTEFLQEETRALPAPLEAEDLYQRIDQLRDDTERLEARVKRLAAQFDREAR